MTAAAAAGGMREELRALIREVIRDQLSNTETVETVTIGTDADLAAFVARLLGLDPAERAEIEAGRKRFRLAAPAAAAPSVPFAQSSPLERAVRAVEQAGERGGGGTPARRVERGAVTERMVREAARAGERLVLGRAAVLTPLAADRARAAGVQIDKEH